MKLDEIILEKRTPLYKNKYKITLEEAKAWKLVRAHCMDALKHIEDPIVRGMTSFEDGFGLVHGAAGERRSRNTSNYYTVILDAVLTPLGFPKRSASLICANWENRTHAAAYGTLHAILPFDGVKIGICPYEDMFDTEIKLGSSTKLIADWNNEFEDLGLKESFSSIVRYFEDSLIVVDEDDEHDIPRWLKGVKPGKVEELFRQAYRKPFKLTTTKEAAYNDGKQHELWIGGKCVAIDFDLYSKMMEHPFGKPSADDSILDAIIKDFEL